jgi:hypothetical protein
MMTTIRNAALALAATAFLLPSAVSAKEVGQVGVDWLGNDIIVEAIADPDVKGVTCHVAYFERGLIDRLQKGNWFEDPSNSSIACRQTGPIEIGDIDLDEGRRGDLQELALADLEEAGRQAHLRQGEQHADLPVAFASGAGRLGEDVAVDRPALRRGRTAGGEVTERGTRKASH